MFTARRISDPMVQRARLARRIGVLGLVAACGLLTACEKPADMTPYQPRPTRKNYNKPLPPGQLALRKIDPADYPDFGPGFHNKARLDEAVRNSLVYMSKPSSQNYYPYGEITHQRAVDSLNAFLRVLSEADSSEALDAAIRRDFDVYQSVGCDDAGTVFFTGYYCPIFDGRKQRDERFRYPLYAMPPDLVKDAEGRTLGRRGADGNVSPYPTRREIEEKNLASGLEIAWLKDPFETYVVTVQGSAKLRLEDGSIYELGYAANNGHEYKPVADQMIQDGVLSRDELSLQALIQYFAAHPDQTQKYCWENPRYVFFREAAGGPFGSINAPVIPYRSLATDKQVFPRACVAFVATDVPVQRDGGIHLLPFGSFALDQDTGGAIRAAGRCDIFMGEGAAAEAVAGRTGAEGKLYYVFVKAPAAVAATP